MSDIKNSYNGRTITPVKGKSIKQAVEDLSRKHDSPGGGLRGIRARNGVDVDGPLDITPGYLAATGLKRVAI